MVRLLITFLLIVSCAVIPVKKDAVVVQKEECSIDTLEKKFYKEAASHSLNLIKRDIIIQTISSRSQWNCVGPDVIGCSSGMIVMLYGPYWESASCIGKEILLFHELGHILGKDHTEPPALMQPNMLKENDYATNREKLLSDFFKL